jgi:lipoprotein signal peptidase
MTGAFCKVWTACRGQPGCIQVTGHRPRRLLPQLTTRDTRLGRGAPMSLLTHGPAPSTEADRALTHDGSAAAAATRTRQGAVVCGVLVAVVLLDQMTKWWAWRHVYAVVNPGGTWFLGRTVGDWFSGQLLGAALDLVGLQVLVLAARGLLRRRRPVLVLVCGTLMLGGWGSNLLDRLGMHTLSAPGSARGAVDFLPLGHYYYNVADVCITGGTLLFLLAFVADVSRRDRSGVPLRPRLSSPAGHRRAWAWTAAAASLLVAPLMSLLISFEAGSESSRFPGVQFWLTRAVVTDVGDTSARPVRLP